MIDAIDEALQSLLTRGLEIKNDEIDIALEQPKREWSARLNRPTLNIFLFDMRENVRLRTKSPAIRSGARNGGGGLINQAIQPIPIDLHYIITAWANEPLDEHRLLARALSVLYRYPTLPEDLLVGELSDQPSLPALNVARYDDLQETDRMWGALDNEMRPGIACLVTAYIDPFEPFTTPLVRSRDLKVGPSFQPATKRFDRPDEVDRFWTVGGTVRSSRELANLHLTVLERGLDVPVADNGDFMIGKLRSGDYTLEVTAVDLKPKQQKITVPSDSYDLTV